MWNAIRGILAGRKINEWFHTLIEVRVELVWENEKLKYGNTRITYGYTSKKVFYSFYNISCLENQNLFYDVTRIEMYTYAWNLYGNYGNL